VSLSHAFTENPINFSDSLSELKSLVKTKIEEARKGSDFETIETDIREAFAETERAALTEVLQRYDVDSPKVEFKGEIYRSATRCEKTYMSSAGPIRVERTLYRTRNDSPCICPLELRSGIIENKWTPKAARIALYTVIQLTPYDAARLFKELGAMQPSKSALDRLPKNLGENWEENKEAFEEDIRQNFSIPAEFTTVGVSLDGVLIPMQGGVVLPGDSRYEEASCGTVTYYNEKGDPLVIRRYGCMPEHKKVSLKSFLKKEVEYALSKQPNLILVKVADGARDNWTFLDNELPKGESVLDFYHASEHLKNAFDIAHGIKSVESAVEFSKYRSILRHDEKGINKVISHLQRLVKKNPRKKLLNTELTYFKNNKLRCQYALLAKAALPIGSGIVEATCKTLVSQRLKRSGMCWKENGGQAILTFRGLYLSNLFDCGWGMLANKYCGDVVPESNVVKFPKNAKKHVSG